MRNFKSFSLSLRGKAVDISQPWVMGIINLTPDSFFPGSRCFDQDSLRRRAAQIVADGARIIDIGAYSSRPNAFDVSEREEMDRLAKGLEIIKKEHPDIFVSVDTFRSSVAQSCVHHFGVDIINDISGGTLDDNMYATVARLSVPYVLMHMRGNPATMQSLTAYGDITADIISDLEAKVAKLKDKGATDIIIDPGFGFSKTLGQNYELMGHLADFHKFNLPILVGLSRKSMIYNLLESSPQEALNGSTVLNTIAIMAGVHMLRVHDVRQAVEAITICKAISYPYTSI